VELIEHVLNGAPVETCRIVYAQIVELHGAAWHEAQRRVEVASDTLVRQGDIPQVVGIVVRESVRLAVIADPFTVHGERPQTDEQILVTAEA
jgi:hypothetical protein